MQYSIGQFAVIKQLELPLVLLELLQLEVLERFLLLELEQLVLLEQLRHIRRKHSQCCCHMSHSLTLERCMGCMSHSMVLERCMCCMSHSLVLGRCMCCMSHSLALGRCMSELVHSNYALHAPDGSVLPYNVLAYSSCYGQLPLNWSTSLLPKQPIHSNVAFFYPSQIDPLPHTLVCSGPAVLPQTRVKVPEGPFTKASTYLT